MRRLRICSQCLEAVAKFVPSAEVELGVFFFVPTSHPAAARDWSLVYCGLRQAGEG
jgi:hypothetical protein